MPAKTAATFTTQRRFERTPQTPTAISASAHPMENMPDGIMAPPRRTMPTASSLRNRARTRRRLLAPKGADPEPEIHQHHRHAGGSDRDALVIGAHPQRHEIKRQRQTREQHDGDGRLLDRERIHRMHVPGSGPEA